MEPTGEATLEGLNATVAGLASTVNSMFTQMVAGSEAIKSDMRASVADIEKNMMSKIDEHSNILNKMQADMGKMNLRLLQVEGQGQVAGSKACGSGDPLQAEGSDPWKGKRQAAAAAKGPPRDEASAGEAQFNTAGFTQAPAGPSSSQDLKYAILFQGFGRGHFQMKLRSRKLWRHWLLILRGCIGTTPPTRRGGKSTARGTGSTQTEKWGGSGASSTSSWRTTWPSTTFSARRRLNSRPSEGRCPPSSTTRCSPCSRSLVIESEAQRRYNMMRLR